MMRRAWVLVLAAGCAADQRGAARGLPATKMPGARVQVAVEKSLALLQKSGATFVKKGGCTSCHHQSLPTMAIEIARERGARIDERTAHEQVEAGARFFDEKRDEYVQGTFVVFGNVEPIAYTLLGLGAGKYAPDVTTDSMALYLKRLQQPDGRWASVTVRPPSQYTAVATTAVAMRALQLYGPRGGCSEIDEAVGKAATWIAGAQPRTTEERSFQLLGLTWAKAGKETTQRAAEALVAEQRPDGGWSQLPGLASDAYATGEALVALATAGHLAATDPSYRRGVEFLIATQHEDGSWLVRSRALPIMPYFESGFPHGRDQFISASGTSWAAMALALALPPIQPSAR